MSGASNDGSGALKRLLLIAATAAAAAACGQPWSSPPSYRCEGCNVVLISIDTLRADHLGLYGYSRPTSPNLERLAEEAVVFDQFVMNGGFTLPSHMTMMTSLPPTVHGLVGDEETRLPQARVTLAEQLREQGYRTAAFVDAGWMRGKFGFDQGFDLYDDEGGRFDTILPKAHGWLEERRGENFMLFLHTLDVHSQWGGLPYACPQPYPSRYAAEYSVDFDGCRNGRCASRLFQWINDEARARRLSPLDVLSEEEVEFSKALYDGCINYVDAKVAEILDHLRSLDILDKTLVLITSDHGEEFLDHGYLLHKQRGFEELARVPLIVRFPGGEFGGRRVPGLAAMVDLMPTILDIVGIAANPEVQGRSLLPAITDGEKVRDNTTIWYVLRTERWKYLPDQQLTFDLQTDPGEQRNLYFSRPAVTRRLAELQSLLMARDQRLADALEAGGSAPPVVLTEKERRELRALGYLR